jgi:hypothetical protein
MCEDLDLGTFSMTSLNKTKSLVPTSAASRITPTSEPQLLADEFFRGDPQALGR